MCYKPELRIVSGRIALSKDNLETAGKHKWCKEIIKVAFDHRGSLKLALTQNERFGYKFSSFRKRQRQSRILY